MAKPPIPIHQPGTFNIECWDGMHWRGGMNRSTRASAIETATRWAAEYGRPHRVFDIDGRVIFGSENAATTHTITRTELQALHPTPVPLMSEEAAALDRLIAIAQTDTGQARRVAAFLLAWWNAQNCGGFDLTDLWAVDTAIARDMQTLFCLIARVHSYPDALGYGGRFEAIVRTWRPQLVGGDRG